jgi:hypothetical protein
MATVVFRRAPVLAQVRLAATPQFKLEDLLYVAFDRGFWIFTVSC